MKNILFYFSAFSLLILLSCGNKCYEFPKYLTAYFPDKEVFVYENSKHDTLKLYTYSYHFSPLKTHRQSLQSKCACYPELVQFLAFNKEKDSLYLEMNINVRTSSSIMRVSFYLKNKYAKEKSTSFVLCKEGVNAFRQEYHALFGDVVEMYPQVKNDMFISRIVILRGKGLIEFDDVANNCTWKLIE